MTWLFWEYKSYPLCGPVACLELTLRAAFPLSWRDVGSEHLSLVFPPQNVLAFWPSMVPPMRITLVHFFCLDTRHLLERQALCDLFLSVLSLVILASSKEVGLRVYSLIEWRNWIDTSHFPNPLSLSQLVCPFFGAWLRMYSWLRRTKKVKGQKAMHIYINKILI